MKKLSELESDTLVVVEEGDECLVVDAGSLMFDPSYHDCATLYIAEEAPATFDLSDIRSMLESVAYAEEQSDGWDDDMYDDLKDSVVVDGFLRYMNTVAKNHMSYACGEQIEDDRVCRCNEEE